LQNNENLKKVALIFFVILGLGHIISGLMMTNLYFLPTSTIINHILEIPFAISALIYGFATIYCGIKAEKQKNIGNLFIFITLSIFFGLLYINIFVPDKLIK
jgi:hypothetical protein